MTSSSPASTRRSEVEKSPHPLNALTADEIKQAVAIVKTSKDFKPNTRFTQIAWPSRESQSVGLCAERHDGGCPRQANITMLDGKHVIESRVDLKDKKILRWEALKDAHGMVLLDDFATVQQIINESPEFAEVLKNAASAIRRT